MGKAEPAESGPENHDIDIFTHDMKLCRTHCAVVHTACDARAGGASVAVVVG